MSYLLLPRAFSISGPLPYLDAFALQVGLEQDPAIPLGVFDERLNWHTLRSDAPTRAAFR